MSITKDFDNGLWFETRDGAGVVTTSEAGATLTCTAAGIDRAYRKYYTVGMPGETLTFNCFARNRPQDASPGFAEVWIDNKDGTEADFIKVKYDNVNNYTVSVTIDITAVGPQRIFFGLGVYGAIEGSADFFEPTLKRDGSNIVMQGLFELPNGGGILLREDWLNYNVGELEWRASTKTYRIKPKLPFTFSDQEVVPFDIQFKPLLALVGAPDGNLTEVYSWTGAVTANVAWVEFQACTHAAAPAVAVDLSVDTNQTRFVTMIVTMDKGG